jgi:hypothetical protein
MRTSTAGTTDTTTGVMKAIAWLRQLGRPILADKMERELLYADSLGQSPTRNQDSAALSRWSGKSVL